MKEQENLKVMFETRRLAMRNEIERAKKMIEANDNKGLAYEDTKLEGSCVVSACCIFFWRNSVF